MDWEREQIGETIQELHRRRSIDWKRQRSRLLFLKDTINLPEGIRFSAKPENKLTWMDRLNPSEDDLKLEMEILQKYWLEIERLNKRLSRLEDLEREWIQDIARNPRQYIRILDLKPLSEEAKP